MFRRPPFIRRGAFLGATLLLGACDAPSASRAFPTAPHRDVAPEINAPHPMNAAALAAGRVTAMVAPGLLGSAAPADGGAFAGGVALAMMTIDPPGIISNGTIQLGVNPTGNLNVSGGTLSTGFGGTTFVGLRYLPTGGEATAPGCLCEGWGVADAATGVRGHANIAVGGTQFITVESFSRTATEATSVVNVQGTMRVTHAYKPVAATPNLYEAEVTIENISTNPIADLRYRRVMDWDISPNTFSEFVTIQGTATAADVLFASNNGFASGDPLSPRGGLAGDFVDLGPNDHGALFDFGFGSLPAGGTKTFKIYYGAAGNEADALAALGTVGAEVYSFGQANWSGAGDFRSPSGAPPGTFGKLSGQPHTFIFAFKGVGGVIVVPPPNQAPTSDPGGPYAGTEGSAIAFNGTGSTDPDGDALTYAWDFESDGIVDATTATASHTYFDNGTFAARLTVDDGKGGTHSQTVPVTVANVAPSLGALTVPTVPLALQTGGTPATVSGAFTDPGTLDTHTGSLSCDGGTAGTVSASAVSGSGNASGVCTFTAAGVYTVSMTVTDDDGGSDTETATSYIVIYDPSAGFVTGGGWIETPEDAYSEDPTLTGKANFGFVSKYQKGATTPSGNTEFQFHAGSLDFHSNTYQWLVIAGARAQYKGVGSIKGREGSYGFLVTAIDGQLSGGGGTDRFRIKIWNAATNAVIYDNQPGQLEDSSAATALGGGSISIKAK